MNVHVRAHLGSARFALIAGEFEIWAWRSRCLQFGRFQNGLSTSANEINVELVPSILANLPDAEGGVLNPIFLLPIHVRHGFRGRWSKDHSEIDRTEGSGSAKPRFQ